MSNTPDSFGSGLPFVHPDVKWQLQAAALDAGGHQELAQSILARLESENPEIHALISSGIKGECDGDRVLQVGVFVYELLKRQIDTDNFSSLF